MTKPNIPSVNPAQTATLEGVIELAIRKDGLNSDGQLPCEILSYDRASNRATVRPLISKVSTGGQITPRKQIASVPVLALGGGGFCGTYPLKRGDLGWIEASDRDISLFMQSLQDAPPNTWRIHDFSAGRLIPDAFRAYTFNSGDDGESMVFQSYDGTVKITLDPAKIRIIAPTVEVTASESATVTTKAATVTATESINFTCGGSSIAMTAAGISITGAAISLNQTGGGPGSTFTGSPVVMPDAIINGVQQSVHTHPDVQNGPDSTGGPQ